MKRKIMVVTLVVVGAAVGAGLIAGDRRPASGQDPTPGYEIVGTFDHDETAFTQGLSFWKGRFFESTGLEGESTLREVELETGEVLRKIDLADRHFGEGSTILKRKVFQITWKSRVAFVYKPNTFKRVGRFRYRGEGWGLTHNRRLLVMSNGTEVIAFRHPKTFRIKRKIEVTKDGEAVTGLNELEWIEGSIFANVWPTDEVVIIDPRSGEVTDSLDLATLRQMETAHGDPDVTNGIAYLASADRLFVTGKYWPHIYEIKLTG